MTSQKNLKQQVRARMATTGERYATARWNIVGRPSGAAPGAPSERPVIDHGYALRGGTDPDAANLANVLAHRGVVGPDGPLPEALVFGIAGGIGAGYILWEFKHDDSRHVTLGFNHSWNYLDRRLVPAMERLGIEAEWSRTAGVKRAAELLRTELSAGNPVVIWPDRFHLGYWHLPATLDGHGGHSVVAYAESNGRVHLDDRTLAPLTVDGADLDRAVARVGSYQNVMLVVRSADTVIDGDRLSAAVRAGLAAVAAHLSSPSDSFGLPAWRKWSRLLVDTKNAKSWPRVFADGRGLLGGLLSVWEGVEPAGMTGGSLRPQFADFLELAGEVTGQPAVAAEASRWRDIAAIWHELAEAAAPVDVPAIATARDLTAEVTGAMVEGDAGAADRAAAAAQLWALRTAYKDEPPLDAKGTLPVFAAMSEQLAAITAAETEAIARLAAVTQHG